MGATSLAGRPARCGVGVQTSHRRETNMTRGPGRRRAHRPAVAGRRAGSRANSSTHWDEVCLMGKEKREGVARAIAHAAGWSVVPGWWARREVRGKGGVGRVCGVGRSRPDERV